MFLLFDKFDPKSHGEYARILRITILSGINGLRLRSEDIRVHSFMIDVTKTEMNMPYL
jgi:hypothetical protein